MVNAGGTIDLSELLTDSLCLQAYTASPTRSIYRQSHQNDLCSRLAVLEPLEVLEENTFQLQEINKIKGSPIQEFFRDSNVLISGVTGFIGKLLVEKLVRSIPHLGHVYLIIREKRGSSAQDRFESLLQEQVFRRMREEVPWYRSKLTPIVGDLSKPGLGLSPDDRQLLSDKVHFIFHSAADVKFTEPLKSAISSNVIGTRRMLNLAKEMNNLKCFLYLSTAFSQCVNRVIKENIPKTSIHYKEVLKIVETLSDKELEEQTPRILLGWPNTYVFSKAICENMLEEEADGLPLCIHRPSVVWPTHREPFRAWTGNLNGHLSIFLGVAMGLLHCFKVDEEITMDIVPADCVVNSMIAAAWQTGTLRDKTTIPVYNFTVTPLCSWTWKGVVRKGEAATNLWPFSESLWYQSFWCTKYTLLDELADMFIHRVQALVFDTLAALKGEKLRLSKIYKKVYDVKPYIQHFALNTWVFENDNVMSLWDSLSDSDKNEFHFDLRDVDFHDIIVRAKLGVRYYLLKEEMDNIPAAERKHKWLYWAHHALKLTIWIIAVKMAKQIAHILPV